MKDQGMPLGDFRFCFHYEPCSQELRARMAALNTVTSAQIRANLARQRGRPRRRASKHSISA